MKTRHLALLSALVPATAFIAGCGGGNGNGPATPTPTPFVPIPGVPLPVPPVPPTIVVPRILFRFPAGDFGILNVKSTGRQLQGELRVFSNNSAGNSLAAGTYAVSGILAAPTAFTLSNQGTGADKFTITGNLPRDASTNGSYTFTRNKFTGTGTLLAPNQTNAPVSPTYLPTGDLQFSDFKALSTLVTIPDPVTPTGAGAFNVPFVGAANSGLFSFVLRDNKVLPFLKVNAGRRNNADLLRQLGLDIQIEAVSDNNPTNIVAGQSFDLSPNSTTGNLRATVTFVYTGFNYTSQSGTLIVKSINNDSVAFELQNVVLDFPGQGRPISNITINGTFAASGITTTISAP